MASFMANWANSTGTARAALTQAQIAADLQSKVCNPGISRVVTHDPWGEYNNAENSMVYGAVMSIVTSGAPNCTKDVWGLGVQATNSSLAGSYSDYVPASGVYGTVKGNFDYSAFHYARNNYTAQEALVDYGALQAAYGWNPANRIVWTWYAGDNEYPIGERTFYRVYKA